MAETRGSVEAAGVTTDLTETGVDSVKVAGEVEEGAASVEI